MAKSALLNFKSDEFLIGSTYSLRNSFDLFNDGILLLRNGRLCRAYTLFQLSIEEAGKVVALLDGFYMTKRSEDYPQLMKPGDLEAYLKKLNSTFYGHSVKMKYMMEYELKSFNGFIEHFNTPPDAGISMTRDELVKDLERVDVLNDLKNHSLYTFIESGKFVLPADKFDIKLVNGLKFKAESKLMYMKTKAVSFLEHITIPEEVNLKQLKNLKLEHV